MLKSKEKTKLTELWVDRLIKYKSYDNQICFNKMFVTYVILIILSRYDADRSHIFLPLELTNSLSFDFNLNDIQCYVKWEEGWKTSVNNEGAFFEDLSEEDLWSCPF